MRTLLNDLVEKGVFAVQPYFTGQRTHTAIVLTQPDETGSAAVCRAEVTGGFWIDPVDIAGSLTAVPYEPNFEAMLSEGGKGELQKHWDEKTYLAKIQRLYASQLADFMNTNKKEFYRIENDCILAAYAYVSKHPAMQAIFERYTPKQTEEDRPRPLSEKDKEKLAGFQTKMFCSQFVTAITQAVLKEVNKALNKELKTKNKQYFAPMTLIPEKDYATMDPGALEEEIKSHYSVAPFPFITRFLLGKDYGKQHP